MNDSTNIGNLPISPTELVADVEAAEKRFNTNKLESFDYLRITDDTPISPPVPIITINNEIISTESNITSVSGVSKGGKSAFTAYIVAGAISTTGCLSDSIEPIYVEPNYERKAVIHFDTEQARHKQQHNVRSILKRANMDSCPEYFLSYNIRQLDLLKYATVTSEICEAAASKFGGIHLMVIDGIADYISDVNDPEQSNAIVKYFEELAIKYRTPILVIVHTNPGTDKERGHLGSQLQRKSESVLTVKKEGDISFVEPKFLRMAGQGSVPVIQFTYDKEKGYHVGCEPKETSRLGKEAHRLNELKSIAQDVFSPPCAYKYGDAVEAIMKYITKGETAAKGVFKELKAHDLIDQGEDSYWRFNAI